jgi:hypothetical protein
LKWAGAIIGSVFLGKGVGELVARLEAMTPFQLGLAYVAWFLCLVLALSFLFPLA